MSYTKFYKLTKEQKKTLYGTTRAKLGIASELAIEKDWWVVHTLRTLFGMPIGEHLIFKGGTSLSKAWGVIERFSEDIDLVLDKSFLGYEGEISRRGIERLRASSHKYITEELHPALQAAFIEQGLTDVEVKLKEIERENEDPITLEVHYPSVIEGSAYIKDQVLVEIGCRSLTQPQTHRNIHSYIYEAFPESPVTSGPIRIPCVNPERTLLEKLFLLHEEFQRPADRIRVHRLSRHLYDIERLANTEYAETAIADKELYKHIVEHRDKFTRVGGVDYASHYPPNLNPIPPDKLIAQWQEDYEIMQQEMIHGESLPFDQLIDQIKNLVTRLNTAYE
jgi:hypothetical protein